MWVLPKIQGFTTMKALNYILQGYDELVDHPTQLIVNTTKDIC